MSAEKIMTNEARIKTDSIGEIEVLASTSKAKPISATPEKWAISRF